MEIRQLRAFVAIAETKTFTAGAKRVHVTQAAISMQISQLEKEVGIPLFTRTPRQVILTEAGEVLLERARRILREHDAAIGQIAELAGAERGRLRIGSASSNFITGNLPKILNKLKKQYPSAEVSVVSGTSEVLINRILAGDSDVAFVSLPVESQHIQTECLLSDEIVAIAHPTHNLAKKKVISAAALAGEKLIMGEKGGNTRRQIDNFFIASGVKPNVVMELSRQSSINEMVKNGMGVGIAGVKAVEKDVKDGKLLRWWIEGAQINWELGLAKLRGGYESPIMSAFIKLCREQFENGKQ